MEKSLAEFTTSQGPFGKSAGGFANGYWLDVLDQVMSLTSTTSLLTWLTAGLTVRLKVSLRTGEKTPVLAATLPTFHTSLPVEGSNWTLPLSWLLRLAASKLPAGSGMKAVTVPLVTSLVVLRSVKVTR